MRINHEVISVKQIIFNTFVWPVVALAVIKVTHPVVMFYLNYY